jgi:hypothetical protein
LQDIIKMSKTNTPFHTKDYTYNKDKKRYEPLLTIQVGTEESKKGVVAWVDSGCTPCMNFCKSYVDEKELTFIRKINKNPEPIGVADGHTINANFYLAKCEIDGQSEDIVVSVIDPEKFFEEEDSEIEPTMPLVGLKLLNRYDVVFKGKARKLELFHPE